MNSSSTDFETVKSYFAFYFVDCKYIVEEIKQIIERYARYETHYGGSDVICNEKEIKRIIKKVIPKHDRKLFVKIAKLINKLDCYYDYENKNFFKFNSDKDILKMITKKYKYYTEKGDKVSCHSNVNILLATSLYDFHIIELSEHLKNTKYDIKYV